MIKVEVKKRKLELKCYGGEEELTLETAAILKNLVESIAESSNKNPVEIMTEIAGYYAALLEEEEE